MKYFLRKSEVLCKDIFVIFFLLVISCFQAHSHTQNSTKFDLRFAIIFFCFSSSSSSSSFIQFCTNLCYLFYLQFNSACPYSIYTILELAIRKLILNYKTKAEDVFLHKSNVIKMKVKYWLTWSELICFLEHKNFNFSFCGICMAANKLDNTQESQVMEINSIFLPFRVHVIWRFLFLFSFVVFSLKQISFFVCFCYVFNFSHFLHLLCVLT